MKRTIVLTLALALGVVAGVAKADFVFGTPTNLGVTGNISDIEGSPSISADRLSLYFTRIGSATMSKADIYVTQRASTSDPWGEPVKLGPAVNSSYYDGEPSISSDGLSLYFGSQRPGGYGGADIWVTTRATTSDPWGEAVNLGPTINTEADDTDVCISADGLSLYIDSFREGGHGGIDLWVATRETLSDPWQEPVNLGTAVNGLSGDSAPSISADGRVLFFSDFFSARPGGQGGPADIWMTMRATVSDPWREPVNLGPAVNSFTLEAHPDLSTDGSTLYFTSDRPCSAGFAPLWQVPILPVVDFNGDGKVNGRDVVTMVGCWGQDQPFCDIGPTPLGDGIVDEQDLFALAAYLEEDKDVADPTLVAHWPLDETDGMTACDMNGENDALVVGGAIWQPDGGMVDGALQLDGVSSFVAVEAIPSLREGPFSILAWVKGGAAGQVVVAANQFGGQDWLYTNAIDGSLMTDLGRRGGSGIPLCSDVVITDGRWHRIGLVWDGANCILLVDEQEAARAEAPELHVQGGALMIGSAMVPTPGRYFSGLIDDVRIYRRAAKP